MGINIQVYWLFQKGKMVLTTIIPYDARTYKGSVGGQKKVLWSSHFFFQTPSQSKYNIYYKWAVPMNELVMVYQ